MEKKTSSTGLVVTPRDVFDFILRSWYWFVLSLVVCVGVAYFMLRCITPTYTHQMVMMVKSESKGNTMADLSGYIDVQTGITGGGVTNEVYILKSYKLVKEIVDRLHLDVSYHTREGLRTRRLHAESPVEVTFVDTYYRQVEMEVTPVDLKSYRLSHLSMGGEEKRVRGEFHWGDTLKTPVGTFTVRLRPERLKAYAQQPVQVTRISPKQATIQCRTSLTPTVIGKNSTLIQVECTGSNLSLIDDVLATLIDVYNEAIVEDRNRIAVNTAQFIDDRIAIIGQELGEVEDELTKLKQASILVSSSTSGGSSLAESRSAVKQVETNLYIANSIRSYLQDATKSNDLIPNVSGVGDAAVQQQVASYNELMLQRQRLTAESGEKNAVVQGIDRRLSELRDVMDGSMDNYIRNLNLTLDKARQNERQTSVDIQMIPKQERMALNVNRQQSIKESLYTYLLNKREENALQLAVTEADVRVIENPFGLDAPIAPLPSAYYIVAVLIALLLPLLVRGIYLLWNTGVRGRKDVENYTSIPVLGEIPVLGKNLSESHIFSGQEGYTSIMEAFKVLRSNLRMTAKSTQVIVMTSTLPNEGKSFVSRNLAIALSLSGKRVVLMDADLRKRTQSVVFNHHKGEDGLSTYLSGNVEQIDDILTPGVVGEKVDAIFAGPMPPNPSELLMNKRFDELVEALKQRYDYVIIDNVPALSISDATEINHVADCTLYVIAEGVLDRRYLPEIETLYQENKFRHMYVVLNRSKVVSGRYGYRYGYHYGYHYGYGYGNNGKE